MVDEVPTLTATVPCQMPPTWAILERRLFDVLDQAVYSFLEKYTREDGGLRWPDRWHDDYHQRDGVDDFYEAFVNWPLYYLLGGGSHVLEQADRAWDAITVQLTALGRVRREYERGYDQFHQSEHYTYFYLLCLADPTNPKHRTRARRFADMFIGVDPDAPNYDAVHNIIRAPMNGSDGPSWGYFEDEAAYPWVGYMAPYGLPYHDVSGITHFNDLKDADLARRMGAAMQARMGKGDVAANLGVVSLIANALLLSGDAAYRAWVATYVGGWLERATANGGLIPDNVGLSGMVGEYMGGKWYGGLYGWTWPHGIYSIGYATIVAATGALLATGDHGYLDLPRAQLDAVLGHGRIADIRTLAMSLEHHWTNQMMALGESYETFVVPYRYGDHGWFDEQPLSPIYPVALWHVTHDPADRARIETLRAAESYDWQTVHSFRTKEDAGHEQPWFCFLHGENPAYPEQILGVALEQVAIRLEQIRQDTRDFMVQERIDSMDIHHWQRLNPLTTEALVQLTLGAPQPIYNGGLLIAPLRYFDDERQRPGLPPDVAALVERVTIDHITLQIVNISPFQTRALRIQAGAFGEHRFGRVRYDFLTSTYPGRPGTTAYAAPPVDIAQFDTSIDGPMLRIVMPPSTRMHLTAELQRWTHVPTYQRTI
ncbi:MAG: hypothetical protein H7Z42_01065 [Roseiflexaceae bacterium]|nr:hypothetical protein [Roseiflexaceae bacterium]